MRRALFVLACAALCSGPLPAEAASKTYTDSTFFYSVDYPESWRVRHVSKVTVIASPRESEEDRFSENVEIVAEDLSRQPENITLLDYYRKAVASGTRLLQDFKVLEEAQTVWADRDAVANLYTMTDKGERFKRKTYTFMAGKTAYVLTYTAMAADYDDYLAKAERIMRSIRVSP